MIETCITAAASDDMARNYNMPYFFHLPVASEANARPEELHDDIGALPPEPRVAKWSHATARRRASYLLSFSNRLATT